jgi:L-iditol 2-dehydrogenase
MQQVILVRPGKIEIKDVPIPNPSAGEVVVKINTALTCGTDLKAYLRGHKLIPMPGPFGHEYSGTIAKIGKGVKGFKEGDHVMGVHSAPCMKCRYCKKQLYNLCEIIMDKKALGAFADYLLLPAHVVKQNLFHKPENLNFEDAALLEPFSCVVHPYGKLRLDEIKTALVLGAGPIGLMHLTYLKMRGIKVIVSDISKERLSIANKIGAQFIALTSERSALKKEPIKNIEDIVKKITDGIGVDLVVECTGQKGVWEHTVNYVRRGGTVILFGGCPAGTTVSYDSHRLHYDELTLVGSFHYTPTDVKIAYQLLIEKNIKLSKLISGKFKLQEIEKALNLLKKGRGIKYALRP